MDTGKQNNDNRFYEGYDGEPEIIIEDGTRSLHIWEGYMGDIFGNPIIKESGWCGLTRDYNEFVGPFDDECIEHTINLPEYLNDAKEYIGRNFEFDETGKVLEAIIDFLEAARKSGDAVTISLK